MAVDLYRNRFQTVQSGSIGITANCDWREPLSDSSADKAAAERALEFFLGWFGDPVYRGDYPDAMRARVQDRLPRFSPDDRSRILGSCDFLGLNHYTTMYASATAPGAAVPGAPFGNGGIAEDQGVNLSADPSWKQTTMGWSIVPWGCTKLLCWIHDRYNAPEIVLTENGCSFDDRPHNGVVDDQDRIEFLSQYIGACHTAIETGVKLRGYFLWSFMDNFEWSSGFTRRFGLHYVDFATGQCIPKSSAAWYAGVLKNNGM
jgi:beta-glucosidase/6-phospho-beta-glucosidase/beta-galactosidase